MSEEIQCATTICVQIVRPSKTPKSYPLHQLLRTTKPGGIFNALSIAVLELEEKRTFDFEQPFSINTPHLTAI